MDVLEIDAATHTQVDKVREIIIQGLGMAPVRNRYKIFIIDEVHRLSAQAFDALLKSIEEPPPHVVFMMATTEIEKVPATIQSRSQVFELKAIGVKQIADQLRTIAAAEQIAVDEAAIMLIARAGDGSMRDAQSAFDQVIAFAGTTITAEDVATVLGLVRRDLLIEHRRRDRARGRAGALRAGRPRRRVRLRPAPGRPRAGADDPRPAGPDDRSVADLRPGDRRRRRAPGAARSVAPVLGRRPDARLRRADQGGIRDPRLDAAALPPRDGAAALASPAQAGAADRSDRADEGRGEPVPVVSPGPPAGHAARRGAAG